MINFILCVHVCTCMCVWMHEYAHMEARSQHSIVWGMPTSFETLWSLLTRLVPGAPGIFPSSPHQHSNPQCVPSHSGLTSVCPHTRDSPVCALTLGNPQCVSSRLALFIPAGERHPPPPIPYFFNAIHSVILVSWLIAPSPYRGLLVSYLPN